jgi:hypothetical protein
VNAPAKPRSLPAHVIRRARIARRRLKLHRARHRVYGAQQPGPPAPFICGATRSGTTLLRLMLDAHPQMAIPPETHFVPPLMSRCVEGPVTADELAALVVEHPRWGDFHLDEGELREAFRALDPLTAADAVRTFYRLYAERHGKTRSGDKTPGYVRKMRRLQRVLPEIHFIHVIRDGRDVALSLLPLNFGPSTVAEAAELWVQRVGDARRQSHSINHYTEVFYEDLVRDTAGVLERVCEYIDLEYDPAMLAYHEGAEERLREKDRDLPKAHREAQPAAARMASHALAMEPPRLDRIGRWRTHMDPADVAAYEAIAGPLLSELGYELANPR